MRSIRFYSFLLASFVALTGCDRPFVPVEPPTITVLDPDLGSVLTDARLPIALQVEAVDPIATVLVNGVATTRPPGTDFYLDTLTLEIGLNALRVEATTTQASTGVDTLYAMYLPYGTANALAATLPEGRFGHAAETLDDGRVLLTGGFAPDGSASDIAFQITESGVNYTVEETAQPLSTPRGSHTATRLPDGRVLIVGGAADSEPDAAGDFVTSADLFDPGSGSFTSLPFRGEPIRRAYHTATLLADAGRTFVYLYGGRGPLGNRIGTRSDVSVLEFKSTAAGDSLINFSPAEGIGAFPALAEHVQLPLPEAGDFQRSLVAGTYVPPQGGTPAPVAFRFLYRPDPFSSPFEIFEQPIPALTTDRTGHTIALIIPGIGIVAGGRSPEGDVLGTMEAYGDGAGRFFAFPASLTLRTPRHRHTATLMPSGRILLVGGLGAAGQALASSELILPTMP